MYHTVLIEDLAVVLCIAGFVAILFQKIRQPAVLGYLLAGIIIGPYTPPFSLIDDENEIRLLAELGVIFLMFSLGMEFTFNKLTRLGLPALIIGAFEVVTMVIIGFFAGKLLAWPPYECFLLGAALAISSTTIIVKALEELDLKRFSFAELMVGILLVEDLMAILLLVYVSTTGTLGSGFSNQILFTSFQLLLVIGSWFLIGYFTVPYLMRKIQHYINHETLTIISIGLCLFLSSIAIYFDYSAALGAFIMGAILAETPLVHKIENLTLPIRDIFAAVFFVSVGMLIDPKVLVDYWFWILVLSIITIIGKVVTCGIGALLAGQSVSDSVKIGFSMAQIGEFSFIIIGLGSSLKTTDRYLYPVVVAIAAITTFATPYLIKFGLKISDRAEECLPHSWQAFLKRYRRWMFPEEGSTKKWHGKYLIRFLTNGMIVAILAIVSAQVFIPHLFPAVNHEWPFQFLFWLVICLLISPFIWAMLFSCGPSKKSSGRAIKFLTWLLTFLELFGLGFIFLTKPILMIPIGLILYGFFKLFFHPIKISYFWLENNLIYNLSRKYEIDPETLQRLAPWEHELVRVKVSSQFPFIGQSLEESRLRPSFGINIVAIKRALTTLWLPSAKERLLPEDELVILGEKDEIDRFRNFVRTIKDEEQPAEPPELQIQSLKIQAGHVLINHPISDAKMKEYVHGLIVGLDRKGQHILNPSPSTILQVGDILLYIAKENQ